MRGVQAGAFKKRVPVDKLVKLRRRGTFLAISGLKNPHIDGLVLRITLNKLTETSLRIVLSKARTGRFGRKPVHLTPGGRLEEIRAIHRYDIRNLLGRIGKWRAVLIDLDDCARFLKELGIVSGSVYREVMLLQALDLTIELSGALGSLKETQDSRQNAATSVEFFKQFFNALNGRFFELGVFLRILVFRSTSQAFNRLARKVARVFFLLGALLVLDISKWIILPL